MRILSLSNISNGSNLQKVSFKNDKTFRVEEQNGVKNYVDTFVKNEINHKKQSTIEELIKKVVNSVSRQCLQDVRNVQRYLSPMNRVEIFSKLASVQHAAGKFDAAAVTLGVAMSNVEKQPVCDSDKARYKTLINTEENLSILKDFFATSRNNKARFFVMNEINNYKSPYFLPVAEDILEFDKDTTLPSDRDTAYIAREFLHQFYDFKLLDEASNKSKLHQNAVLNILDKWGLFADKYIVENIKDNATDNVIKAKIKNLLDDKLLHIGMHSSSKAVINKTNAISTARTQSLTDLLHRLFENSDNEALKELKKYKYPQGMFNASLVVNELLKNKGSEHEAGLTKFVGQTAVFLKHLDFVKPIENDYSAVNKERAEAYYKILLRSSCSN